MDDFATRAILFFDVPQAVNPDLRPLQSLTDILDKMLAAGPTAIDEFNLKVRLDPGNDEAIAFWKSTGRGAGYFWWTFATDQKILALAVILFGLDPAADGAAISGLQTAFNFTPPEPVLNEMKSHKRPVLFNLYFSPDSLTRIPATAAAVAFGRAYRRKLSAPAS